MKRNMNVVRNILEFAERHGDVGISLPIGTEFAETENRKEIAYHLMLLIEGGFLITDPDRKADISDLQRLTWRGHDLLDSLRDQDSTGNKGDSGDASLR